jgi:hypothetical protein
VTHCKAALNATAQDYGTYCIHECERDGNV